MNISTSRLATEGHQHPAKDPMTAAELGRHVQFLCAQLRRARKNCGVALTEMRTWSEGRFTGYTVGGWERGDLDIPAHRLIELAHLYQTPLTDFFNTEITPDTGYEITLSIDRLASFDPGPLTAYAQTIRHNTPHRQTITLTGSQIQNLAKHHHVSAHQMFRELQAYI